MDHHGSLEVPALRINQHHSVAVQTRQWQKLVHHTLLQSCQLVVYSLLLSVLIIMFLINAILFNIVTSVGYHCRHCSCGHFTITIYHNHQMCLQISSTKRIMIIIITRTSFLINLENESVWVMRNMWLKIMLWPLSLIISSSNELARTGEVAHRDATDGCREELVFWWLIW